MYYTYKKTTSVIGDIRVKLNDGPASVAVITDVVSCRLHKKHRCAIGYICWRRINERRFREDVTIETAR